MRQCSLCGGEQGEVSIGFQFFCRDCARQAAMEEGVMEALGEDYIEKQGADFFLDWFWEGLTEEEKLEGAKLVYREMEERDPGKKKESLYSYLKETGEEWIRFLRTQAG